MIRWGDKTLMARINGECRGFEDCDIVWFPRMPRQERIVVDGVAMGHRASRFRGCWALACFAEVPFASEFHGATVISTVTRPLPIWKLDGKYGNPRTPGDWMIYEILVSDLLTQGIGRLRELQEMEEASIERRHRHANSLLDSAAAGKDTKAALRAMAEETGVPDTLREERIAEGAALEKRAEQADLKRFNEVKDAAFL